LQYKFKRQEDAYFIILIHPTERTVLSRGKGANSRLFICSASDSESDKIRVTNDSAEANFSDQ
jgi:hypothetical protein